MERRPGERIRRFFLKAGMGLLAAFLLLSLLPYLIPLPRVREPRGPFPESTHFDFQGGALHYRVWTSGEIRGKALLVHGLGGSTFSWRHNAAPLVEAGYLVAAVDLPGFGYSSRSRGMDHSQTARARILWKLMDHLDRDLEREAAALDWNLVGHSMGGGTIAAMALQDPHRVESLTFAAGSVYGRPPGTFSRVLSYPPTARWLQLAAHYYFLTFDRVEGLLTSAYGREPSAEEVTGYLEPLSLPGTLDTLLGMARTPQTSVPLENITAPALLIWGEEDAWVPLDAGRRLAENLPAAELRVIPGTGHCPMETRPQEFNLALLDFLEKVQGQGR